MNQDFAIGLHIVGFLASQGGRPATSECLAELYGTSPVVLRRVLSRLNQSGLVESARGVGGGSVLAKDPNEINLREVYEAATEDPELLRRYPADRRVVPRVLGGYINDLFETAEEALLSQFESITLAAVDRQVGPRICRAFKQSSSRT